MNWHIEMARDLILKEVEYLRNCAIERRNNPRADMSTEENLLSAHRTELRADLLESGMSRFNILVGMLKGYSDSE